MTNVGTKTCTMTKAMLDLLNVANRSGIDVDDFYVVNVMENTIRLQGEMDSDKIIKYQKIGFDFTISKTGFAEAIWNDNSDKSEWNGKLNGECICAFQKMKITLT